MPNLIIFDCDGVLIDSERIACRVDAGELTANGVTITAETLAARFCGVPYRDMYRILEAETGVKLPAGYVERTRTLVLDACAAEGEALAIPGIHEAIDALAGRAMCVASSSSHVWLKTMLDQVGLWRRLAPNIFSASEVARGKPAPDLFLHAAARMATTAAECMVIEDSVAGVTAAKAAGMKVLGFCGAGHCAPDHAKRLLAAGAMSTFDQMSELPALLT